ncbi:MAG: SLAP domain-containing protein [Bacillota bacterium]|nr:SLAP domain-containing protein [Bacillota bacterium]
MKKAIISIMVMGTLIISLVGCSSKNALPKDGQVNKAAAVESSKRPAVSEDKDKIQAAETTKVEPEKEVSTPPAVEQKNDNSVKEAPKIAEPENANGTPKAAEPAKTVPTTGNAATQDKQTPTTNTKTTEFVSTVPITSTNAIQISPKHVYYNGSDLCMDAFVYNGFNHPVYDITNVGIKLSNSSGVIAAAAFGKLGDVVIQPQSYIVWTFVFDSNSVKLHSADLSHLKTEFECDNSY